MKRLPLFQFVILSLTLPAFGQEVARSEIPRFQLMNMGFMFGSFDHNSPKFSVEEQHKIAPNSSLLNTDLSAYRSRGDLSDGSTEVYAIFADFGIRNSNHSGLRKNILIRTSLSYVPDFIVYGFMYKNQFLSADTFVSPQTGHTIQVKNWREDYFEVNNESHLLKLELAFQYGTNTDARWRFYTGVGATGGIYFSVHNYVFSGSARFKDYADSLLQFSVYDFSADTNPTYDYNEHSSKNNYSVGACIPLGIDFRLSDRGKVASKVHLFYEFKAGVNWIYIPEVKTYTAYNFQHQVGIKYSLL